jgi:hypothetical protein
MWVDQRKEALLEKVSAHDVLRYFGVDLKFGGDHQEEQICCPFHGDSNPSARVFPDIGGRPSHVFCYVCRGKGWDIFALWKLFNSDPEMKFTAVLRGLEKAFGLTTPEAPDMSRDPIQQGPTEEELVVIKLLDACENRLRNNKAVFALEAFLKIGKLLDQLHYQVELQLINLDEAEERIRQVLAKISEKVRSA